MAFASTISDRTVFGNKRIHFGAWTTDTTGGDINTGLKSCESIFLQPTGSSVSADHATVNEALPVDGSAITIVCTSAIPGNWMAIGY